MASPLHLALLLALAAATDPAPAGPASPAPTAPAPTSPRPAAMTPIGAPAAPPGSPAEPRSGTLSVEAVLAGAPPGLLTLTLEQARQLPGFLREEVRAGPSDWRPGETAEHRTVVVPGLALRFVVHAGQRSFLASATYSRSSWVLPGGLAVGVPGDLVRRLLGPGDRDGNVLRYVSVSDAAGVVEIRLQSDLVAEITLIPYTG